MNIQERLALINGEELDNESIDKFKLLNLSIDWQGRTLYRIKALKNFSDVKRGDLGGWVKSIDNISQTGDCWIYNEAKCCDYSFVSENAKLLDNSILYDYAKVFENCTISSFAKVYNSAKIFGSSIITGNAKIYGNAKIHGECIITNNSKVYDNARCYGKCVIKDFAEVFDSAEIYGDANLCRTIKVGDKRIINNGVNFS
jgi:carbonic anhydrase/acetyltransferase-like protein (isoleucine patch superfamily)